MNTRSRLIAIVVFLLLTVGLVALLLLADLGGVDEEIAETVVAPGQLFPDTEGQAVISFRVVDNRTGEAFAASTDDGETWTVDEAPEGADTAPGVDNMRIFAAVSPLPTIQPTRVLSEIEALAPYGLEDARYPLTFRLTNGHEHTLYVGERAPASAAYYARLTDALGPAGEVYLIPAGALDPVLSFVEQPPVLIPTPEVEATGTP